MASNRRVLWVVLAGTLAVVAFCSGLSWLGFQALRTARRSIIDVAHQNPNLQKAILEARSLLPKFKDRLKHPEPGDRFAIEAKFDSPLGPEYLWMKDPALTKSGFSGTIDQVPVQATEYKKGEKVEVRESAVVDWLIRRADRSEMGGFTNLALGGAAG